MGSLSRSSHVDLLIIGAGPAGIVAAAWAAQFNISTRIIDKEPTRTQLGHADGLQPRTIEIFDSFGLADQVVNDGCPILEIACWAPDSSGGIHRIQRVLSQKEDDSKFTQTILQQGAVEQLFEDYLRKIGSPHIERGIVPIELQYDPTCDHRYDSYPITVRLQRTEEGEVPDGNVQSHHPDRGDEIVRARYMWACDGGHSWVRKQLRFPMEGKSTREAWGVIDIIPITDFPDIRQSCAIHSANSGSMMTVPRENRIVRLYVSLPEETENVSPETILKAAQQILAPYTIRYEFCEWSSTYRVGQHVAPHFTYRNRIFLSGDAVHTHSPKLGQGMNVSMQDSYNLGWKLGAVLEGWSKRDILATYEPERRNVAQKLLEVDQEITKLYSRNNTPSKQWRFGSSADNRDLQAFRNKHYGFMAGTIITYQPSSLVVANSTLAAAHGAYKPDLFASNVRLGGRFPLFNITNHAEAVLVHSLKILGNNGRWRLIVFPGDLSQQHLLKRFQVLGSQLSGPEPPLKAGNPPTQALGRVIELLTIHCGSRKDLNILDFHEIYHPFDDKRGWDYWKIYVDDTDLQGGHSVYDQLGIKRRKGCIVVVRPDQHVGFVGSVEDLVSVRNYFSQILVQGIQDR